MATLFSRFFDWRERTYIRQLDYVLHRSGRFVLLAILFFGLTLPIYYGLGGEFFPPVDDDQIVLDVQREPGVSLLELERTFEQVEEIVEAEVPEARLVVSEFGDKEGVEGADNPGGYQGRTRIELVPSSDRDRSEFEIASALLERLETVPGAEINEFRQDKLSPDGQTGLIIQISGYDSQQKKELARFVAEELKEIEGVINVFSSAEQGRPELRVRMDRERISRLGMNTSQVAEALSNAVKGNIATTFVDEGIEHDVVVELEPREKARSTDLKSLQIKTPAGEWMPLQNLATIQRYQGPSNILRLNQERAVEVKADLAGIDLKQATQRAQAQLDQINWPEGYRYTIGGTAEEQQMSFYYLIIAFIVAGVLTYMVMASQFESLIEPFIILLTIPLALSGVLIMLWLTGTPISVTSMVGLILLSGIVVNNGIVMIDYIKILQARHYDRHNAVLEGATRRLRPILMTAFTTILSMVPLALELGSGSETWSPMARTVIGGLTMSTLLMLFVVPSLYKMINAMVENFGFDAIHKYDPLQSGGEYDTAPNAPSAG